MTDLYLGLMSGTSIDSIDAALIEHSQDEIFNFVKAINLPIGSRLQHDIFHLSHTQTANLDLIGACDRAMGELFADAALELINEAGVSSQDVRAIGSHGQTIRHRPTPDSQGPFTWQIGDPNIIAHRTGIDTVADFRRMDMAAGGQAAPLAPIFHQALFGASNLDRSLCNIGGISNVTWLPANGEIAGFDLGPGNMLMDGWVRRHKNKPFDHNGQWAQAGSVNPNLLQKLMSHPFLALPPPKSTGRETFNLAWLDSALTEFDISPQDVQATLLEFTAQSIAQGMGTRYLGQEFYVCGGGVQNKALMNRLAELLDPARVASTDSLGFNADWVEACGFAWLAYRRLKGLSGNHRAVTGASKEKVLGGLYSG